MARAGPSCQVIPLGGIVQLAREGGHWSKDTRERKSSADEFAARPERSLGADGQVARVKYTTRH
jgi:hypothetical protein